MNREQAATLGRGLAGARVLIGLGCMAVPSLARVWLGREASSTAAKVLSRSLAARDIALGAGTAISRDDALPTWVGLSALADATDVLGSVLAYKKLPAFRRSVITAVSAAAAASGVVAAVILRSTAASG